MDYDNLTDRDKMCFSYTGGGKGTGKKSHIFDFPNGTEIWRKFAKLRMQLFPYLYTQAHIAHEVRVNIFARVLAMTKR